MSLMRHKINWKKYAAVSFDVFDTLIERLVCNPTDVFALVESRALRQGLSVYEFSHYRTKAERNARETKSSEITLDEIYQAFDDSFQGNPYLEELKELELDVEKSVCVCKKTGLILFEEARKQGKPIAVTSDMYLPEDFIASLLTQCGYVGWSHIFVSCKHTATKATGDLYPLVAAQMGFLPSQIIHIGDNRKSDYIRAKAAGFDAYLIVAKHHSCSTLTESFVRAAIESRASTRIESLFDMGYSLFGPLLLGFSIWLHDSLRAYGINRVFFFARDGLIMQRAFETLYPAEFETHYLYASRRALQVPSFSTLESFDKIIGAMFLPRLITLENLFIKMGLDPCFVREKLTGAGIDLETERRSVSLTTDLEAHQAYELLKDEIVKNSLCERKILQSYLHQSNFAGRCAIVDIGWFGNMQVALERLVNASGTQVEIIGFYVGLQPDGKNQLHHNMNGYLFDATHGKTRARDERNFNLIFETLFSACHGTTKGYAFSASGIVPILATYDGLEEYVGMQAEEMRKGALEFIRDAKRVFDNSVPAIPPNIAFESLNTLGNRPNLKEARFFGEWAIEADGSLVYAAKPDSLNHYVLHPKRLLHDFVHASWKVGYLKQLFKLPLPYNRIWNFIHGAYVKHQKSH